MLEVIRINGDSMSPTLHNNDYVVIFRRGWFVRPGSVVVANHRKLGKIIKRVGHVDEHGDMTLIGDSPRSTGSEAGGIVR